MVGTAQGLRRSSLCRKEPGEVDAVLLLDEHIDRPRFLLSATNNGSESTGEWIFSGTYFNDQLTGMDDSLGVSYMFSNTMERHALNASYYLRFFLKKLWVWVYPWDIPHMMHHFFCH